MKAAVKRTDHAPSPHLTPLAEGREVTAFAGLEQALENPGQRLTDDQRACLFANITEKLAGFNNRQKRCFAAHAIAIIFIDGLWKGTKQEFMELAAKRLLIVQFDVHVFAN